MTTTQSSTAAPETDLDLFSDEVLNDPFPHYKALRDLGPVVYLTKYDLYGLFRYDRVRAALRDWQTFSSAQGVAFNDLMNGQIRGQSVLGMDPPQHTAVRKVFDDSLKPKFIRRAAGDIEQRAEELVDGVIARKEFDGVRDFACRLPVEIVLDLVGVPRDEARAKILGWVPGTFNTLGPEGQRQHSALPAQAALLQYATEKVKQDRVLPGSFGEIAFGAAAQRVIAHPAATRQQETLPGVFHELDGEVVGSLGLDDFRSREGAVGDGLDGVDWLEAVLPPGSDDRGDVVDVEAEVEVAVVAGPQGRGGLAGRGGIAQQLDGVVRGGDVADTDHAAGDSGDLLEHFAAARDNVADRQPEGVAEVADRAVHVRDRDAGVADAGDVAGAHVPASAIAGVTPAVSTTQMGSPILTSAPSATQCSTITPSAVAVTSWLIFSVSISYSGSPCRNGSPGCLQNRTSVASSMVIPILGSLTRTRRLTP